MAMLYHIETTWDPVNVQQGDGWEVTILIAELTLCFSSEYVQGLVRVQ